MAYVKRPRVGFSAEAAHSPTLPQACGPHLSTFLTPVCSSTPVIMPEMLEIRLPQRVVQDPGLDEAEFFWSEEEEEEEQMEEEEHVEEVEQVEEVE